MKQLELECKENSSLLEKLSRRAGGLRNSSSLACVTLTFDSRNLFASARISSRCLLIASSPLGVISTMVLGPGARRNPRLCFTNPESSKIPRFLLRELFGVFTTRSNSVKVARFDPRSAVMIPTRVETENGPGDPISETRSSFPFAVELAPSPDSEGNERNLLRRVV